MHDPTTLSFRIRWLGIEAWHTDPSGDHGPPCWDRTTRRARRFWKWHVHHVRLVFRPWWSLRRFFLSRCNVCKRGFPLGYTPISNCWDAPRPKFLRGETHIRHFECSNLMGVTHDRDELLIVIRQAARGHVARGGTYRSFVNAMIPLEADELPEGLEWTPAWRIHYRLERLFNLQEDQQVEVHG